MSTLTYAAITYGGLSFTNDTVTETDTGTVAAFTAFPGVQGAAATTYGTALTWGGVNAGVYGPNSSVVVNFSYTVTSTSSSSLIDSLAQVFTGDSFAGLGVSLVSTENVYTTAGALIGTDVYTYSPLGSTVSTATLSSAQQSVNVTVSLNLSVGILGTSASLGVISAFQQAFGTIANANTASIGDIVFNNPSDTGLEPAFDSGPGVAGVTVDLLNATGTSVLAVTTTNASGLYSFNNLAAGVYEVKFIAPTGYAFTPQGVGTNPAINSSANATTGITAPITLTAGQADHNVEAGLYATGSAGGATASIGNTVWLDANCDGLDDNGEAGIAGVTVELLNGAGTSILATTTTNSSGNYQFTSLAAGTYEVKVIAPANETFTTQNVASSSLIDSVVNSAGLTSVITLSAGQVDNNVNAGLMAKAQLGDYVWFDANKDGLIDNGETGVGGVKVSLLAADTLTLKISEDYYLANAQYTVSVNGVQIGGVYTATASHAAGQDTTLTLQGDFGTNPNVTVTFLNDAYAGTPQTDRNLYVDGITYNGVNENQSYPLYSNGGHTFNLTGAGGSVIATTVTNSAGYYEFNNLNAGVYEVAFTAPSGDTFTTQGVGTNPALDSSPNASTGVTGPITLTACQIDNNVEAGLVNASGISVLKLPCSVVVNQCGQVTYTFDVTNTGSTPLTNVKITDNIGSAANPDIVTPTLLTQGTNGILNAGQTWVYTETVNQIDCTAGGSGSVCHTTSGGYLSSGCTAWLHSTFNPTSCADGATYKFQGVSCTISGGGVGSTPIHVQCPDSVVTFSNSCSSPTTVYNASTNCWVTTLPANCNPGSVFLTGCPQTIPSGCDLTNATVTWSVGDASNNCGASTLTWDGGCTGYQSFNVNGCNGSTDYNQIGVKSCDNHAGYGTGGETNIGYGYSQNNGYCDYGYNNWGGGCGSWYTTTNWQGCGSDNAGTPENQFCGNNVGNWSDCNNYSWQNSCGTSNSISQNGVTGTSGAADTVTVSAVAVTGESCTTTTNCGTHLTSGCTAWLSSTFKPTSCADGATYNFHGVQCTIEGSGVGSSPITINCPDSQVKFSSSCTSPTTVFNASTNCWVTTLPANCTPGNVFLTGCPQTIASGCDLSNAQVTWSVGSSTNNCGASTLNWDGTCSGYQSFNQNGCNGHSDYNQIGVKSCDDLGSSTNGASCAGAPCNQYSTSNCGYTVPCTTQDADSNICGTTCTTTVTSTGVTVTASDTKEVQILGCNSNVSVDGCAPTGSLSATYGAAQTLEFTYNPGNTVCLQQVQAGLATCTGSNANSLAFMEISNNTNPFASGSTIYFEGAVTAGEKIYADATTNELTNTPVAGGHFSTTAGADIYGYVWASQQAFLAGTTPIETIAYNASGSQAMHIGDTIGSLTLSGYVGASGGHLSS